MWVLILKKLKEKNKKRIKVFLISCIAIILLVIASFLIYASYYYKADDIATQLMKSNSDIEVVGNATIIPSTTQTDTAFIFYPGAKVESKAYLPILEKLAQNNITCILVDMPLNMAIFNSNAADDVFKLLPNVKNWYIGGHSMGGAMASSYASKNKDKVKGLVLLGAYVYGDYPPEKALTVYGTLNSNLEKNIDYKDNIVVIEGGNHAQFGNYGEQKNDPLATISREKQQDIAVDSILEFIK